MFDAVIVDGLPGPELAAAVAGCDLARLTPEQKLHIAAAAKRLAAWSEALLVQAVASFAADQDTITAGRSAEETAGGVRMLRFGGDGTPQVEEFTPEEVAVALTIAPSTARALVGHALDLTHRFPAVTAALARGETDGFRAKIITDTTRRLDRHAATRVQTAVLPQLARVTTRQLDKLVTAETIAADPHSAQQSELAARTVKGVWTERSYPGLTALSAELDTDAAARLDQQITTIARLLRRHGRTEPWQELRADALGMLADPTTIHTLQATAAAGDRPEPERDDTSPPPHPEPQPAGLPRTVLYLHRNPDGRYDLDGHGPITDQHAQRILRHSHNTIKPVIDLNNQLSTGSPPGHNSSPGYIPTTALREAIQIRDRTCRFPGCTRPARSCQIDHTLPWPQGPTTFCNLCCLCTRHHRMKTHTSWQVEQPFPGILIWRSPTGSIHLVDQHGTTHRPPPQHHPRAGPHHNRPPPARN